MSTKERIQELIDILNWISLEEYATLSEEINDLLKVIESNNFLLT